MGFLFPEAAVGIEAGRGGILGAKVREEHKG